MNTRDNVISSNSILLTYKGRILLLSQALNYQDVMQSIWRFIGGEKLHNESSEEAIFRQIRHQTQLKFENIKRIPSPFYKDKYFFHGVLTDNDVNSIERREGQRLEFFKLSEIENLSLEKPTSQFFAKHKREVGELLAN